MDSRLALTSTTLQTRADLAALVPAGGVFIELGVAAGLYAKEVLERNPALHYLGIDRWADHHDLNEMDKVRMRLQPHATRVGLWRESFDAALPKVPDASADLVYVDGYAHTGQEGGKTLDDWWAKVKPGGFLAGHDYHPRWPLTGMAVDAFARKHALPVQVIREVDTFHSWVIAKPITETPMIAPGARVVVVGNGPLILADDWGTDIDTFDEVVRINRYRLQGFERHTGTRTTLWATVGHGELPQDDGPRAGKVLMVQDSQKPGYFPEQIWRIPRAFVEDLSDRLRTVSRWDREPRDNLLASSGCIVVAWLLEHHALPQVWGAGFDHFSKARTGLHHYWLKTSAKMPKQHDGDAERILFHQWHEAGRWLPLS